MAREATADRALSFELIEGTAESLPLPDHEFDTVVTTWTNLETDLQVLAVGGSIATYATNIPAPSVPVWPLIFKNIRLMFLGSDDFPSEAKAEAAQALNDALERGWRGFGIAETFSLSDIAASHERVEHAKQRGRIMVIP